jgi:hypothetical protein
VGFFKNVFGTLIYGKMEDESSSIKCVLEIGNAFKTGVEILGCGVGSASLDQRRTRQSVVVECLTLLPRILEVSSSHLGPKTGTRD